MSPAPTPSQTVGPFFSIGLAWEDGPYAVAEDTPGSVWIRGHVLDGAGAPVPDALVETLQADSGGGRSFARCATDEEGRWGVLTTIPGVVMSPGGGEQAPHLLVSVFARGLLNRVVTRIHFPDHAEANALDPALGRVPEERRSTLVAARSPDGYRFDISLQGPAETVFFDV
jgi:protocatechuate 3,4-dioxygenase, alpha subunit